MGKNKIEEIEVSALDKFKYVLERIKAMDTYPIIIAESCCDDNLDRAYELLKENPDISLYDYLEIMDFDLE